MKFLILKKKQGKNQRRFTRFSLLFIFSLFFISFSSALPDDAGTVIDFKYEIVKTINQTAGNETGLILNWSNIISGSNLNDSGLILNWSNIISGSNLNDSGIILNWSNVLNRTGFIIDWNWTGFIIDWNWTGFIRDWRSEINDTGILQNYNASGHITNENATGFIINWTEVTDHARNNTGLVLNWSNVLNRTGFIINWNWTGFIRDWRSEINDTGILANWTEINSHREEDNHSLFGATNVSAFNTGDVLSNEIDLRVGSDFGALSVGNVEMFLGNMAINNLNLNGTWVTRNRDGDSSIKFAWAGKNNLIRFAIPKEGASFAIYNPRSMMIGGSLGQAFDDGIINCTAQGYQFIDCSTDITGADLGVRDDVEIIGRMFVGNGSMNVSDEGNIDSLGNITLNASIFNGDYEIGSFESNEFINKSLLTISFDEEGFPSPHLILQSGGFGQANVIARSTIFANENTNILNTLNQTDCKAWADIENFTLKVDCNSTRTGTGLGTGADLVMMGDIQVKGESWLRDTTGEWKFISRELQLRDEFYTNLFFNNLTTSIVSANNYSFTSEQTLVINIGGNESILEVDAGSILLSAGTSADPVLNYIHYADIDNPSLEVNTSQPTKVSEVARVLMGGSGNVYSSMSGITDNEQMARKLYAFAVDIGPIYVSGFDISSIASGINIAEGTMSILLSREILNEINLTEGFFMVLSNGTFIESTTLEDILQYSDGNTISNNRFYNIVAGIVHSDVAPSRMMFVIQSTPSSEYNNLQDAEVDKFDATNFFPSDTASSDSQLQNTFLPIARLIVQKRAGDDEFQQLSNDLFHFDERGLTSKAGASATPSITDHDDLNKLEFNDSSHTFNNLGKILNIGAYNLSNNESITAGWVYATQFFGNINVSELLNTNIFPLSSFNLDDLFVSNLWNNQVFNDTADGRYVNTAGDTMTGPLVVPNGINTTSLNFTAHGNVTHYANGCRIEAPSGGGLIFACSL